MWSSLLSGYLPTIYSIDIKFLSCVQDGSGTSRTGYLRKHYEIIKTCFFIRNAVKQLFLELHSPIRIVALPA